MKAITDPVVLDPELDEEYWLRTGQSESGEEYWLRAGQSESGEESAPEGIGEPHESPVPDAAPEMPKVEHKEPVEAHKEAHALIFGNLNGPDGQRWSITIREGVTPDEIDGMLEAWLYLCKRGMERGWLTDRTASKTTRPAAAVASTHPTKHPAAPPKSESTETAEGGTWTIGSLQIAGTLDKPVVQMFDTDPRLHYPRLTVPASLVAALLDNRYNLKNADHLKAIGMTYKVAWTVTWVRSAKNPKWKDLVDIKIAKLEK